MWKHLTLLTFLLLPNAWSENTFQEWNAKSGHTVEAKLLHLKGMQIHIEKQDQKTLSLSIETFIEEDQQRILAHFGMEEKLLLSERSATEPLTDCVFPMGKVHGPVEADNESTYYVYVPTSLKNDRLAPLLFYTNAAGGDTKHHLETLSDTAELFSCILAYSLESSNANGWENNLKEVEHCMTDLFKKLPIDKGRIHYTGNSGGGNTACLNSSINKAWGLMPNVAMLPEGHGVDTEVIYATGGATDHNRFLTAHAADLYGKEGFHRMSKNGHGDAPVEHRCDGMLWMTCKYFAKHKEKHPEEIKDFEYDILTWLNEMKKSDSQRAYSNATILKDIYGLEGENLYALNTLMKELSLNTDNLLYHEGLITLDEFSEKHLAPIGKKGWFPKGHAGVEGLTDLTTLKEKYGHLSNLSPVIEGLFQSAPRVEQKQ